MSLPIGLVLSLTKEKVSELVQNYEVQIPFYECSRDICDTLCYLYHSGILTVLYEVINCMKKILAHIKLKLSARQWLNRLEHGLIRLKVVDLIPSWAHAQVVGLVPSLVLVEGN